MINLYKNNSFDYNSSYLFTMKTESEPAIERAIYIY